MYSIDKFSQNIPQNNQGYKYIGRTKIYCPFYEFGLEVLERTEMPLSYIYETILKYIDSGIENIDEMCNWLGLDETIVGEIISDMASYSKLVHRSQDSLVLTPAGKEALFTLNKIEQRKYQLNGLIMNAVSGIIYEENNLSLFDTPPKPYMYFDTQHELELKYLNSNFEQIDVAYKKQKTDSFNLYQEKSILFRILKINYKNLRYAQFSAQIYIHEDNLNLLVLFPNNSDFDYSSIVYQHIMTNTQGSTWFFERDLDNKRFWKRSSWDDLKYTKNLDDVIAAYFSMQKGEISDIDFQSFYFKDRNLLSGELHDLLLSLEYFKSRQVIILSSQVLHFLANREIVGHILSIISRIKIIFYYYSSDNEYMKKLINKAIEDFIKAIPEKHEKNVAFKEVSDTIDQTVIISKPGFVIGSTYNYVADSSGKLVLQEISGICFNPQTIDKWIEMINDYAIEHSLPKDTIP